MAPMPPPTEPPMMAARFEGDDDDPDEEPEAFDAFEGTSPVSEAVVDEVNEDEENGGAREAEAEEERDDVELELEDVVKLAEVVVDVEETVEVDDTTDEVEDETVELSVLEAVVEEEMAGVGGPTGQLLSTVETGTEVTNTLVAVTVRASVVVMVAPSTVVRTGSMAPLRVLKVVKTVSAAGSTRTYVVDPEVVGTRDVTVVVS